jgi:uncharacterized protein YdhG (YjbR/CyaY superfamily)
MDSKNEGFQSIDEYIATFPADVQKILQEMRTTIKAAAPDATEKISYQMPTFAQAGNLVYFGASKNHIGFYPTPGAITAFKDQLSDYESSKGTVQFPLGKPLPLDLITRMVEFRVAENLKKAADKSRTKK